MNTVLERIYLNLDELTKIEREISIRNHIQRYLYIRHLCRGQVLDFGCGCGYGSHIISKNPDVNFVHGVDISEEAIIWANNNFKSNNILFYNDYSNFNIKIDVLIAFEIIEHIKNKLIIPNFADQIQAKEIIISFPSIKSTHFNKFHYYDFNNQEIIDLFDKKYLFYKEYKLNQHVNILHFLKK